MSQENVEVVRATWTAYALGYYETSLAAYAENGGRCCHPAPRSGAARRIALCVRVSAAERLRSSAVRALHS